MTSPLKVSNEYVLQIKEKALELTRKTGRTVTMKEVTEKAIKQGLPIVDEIIT